VRGTQGIAEWLLDFIGLPIRKPLPGEPPPAATHVPWRRREVFREPARAVGETW
jgi:hypothetical protein